MGNTLDRNYYLIQQIYSGRYTNLQKVFNKSSSEHKMKRTMRIHVDKSQKFNKLINILMVIQHPNLIRIEDYEIRDSNQESYKDVTLIMQNFSGKPITNYLQEITTEQIRKVYKQVKQVIIHLHLNNLLNNNLKIYNMFIDDQMNLKVWDYGFNNELLEILTAQIKQQYNHFYKPPEIIIEGNQKADLWNLGILVTELYVGKCIRQFCKTPPNQNPELFYQTLQSLDIKEQLFKLVEPLLAFDSSQRTFYQGIDLSLQKIDDTLLAKNLETNPEIIELNCSNCFITDEAAFTIMTFSKKLKILDISGNNIGDKFMINAKPLLPSLQNLNISFTNITDESMNIITDEMRLVRKLDLSYTHITEEGLKKLKNLRKLKFIGLWNGRDYTERFYDHVITNIDRNYIKYHYNKVEKGDEIISILTNFNLREFAVKDKEISKKMQGLINSMQESILAVQTNTKINEEGIDKIFESKRIKRVYFKNTNIKGKEIKSKDLFSIQLIECDTNVNLLIKNLRMPKNVTMLNLKKNNLGNQAAIEISKNFQSLIHLNLDQNHINQYGACEIAKNLIKLRSLTMNDNSIGDVGLIQIGKRLANLQTLKLAQNKIKKNQGLIEISKNLFKLITLDLRNNQIRKQGLSQISKNLVNLQKLHLGNSQISKEAVTNISQNLKKLTNLNLKNNKLEIQGTMHVSISLINLVFLNLSSNNIGDQAVVYIGLNLKLLEYLTLDNNSITKVGVKYLCADLKKLIKLSLDDNKIRDEGAFQISKSLTQLQILCVRNCQIRKIGAFSFVHDLKKLRSLNLAGNPLSQEQKKLIKSTFEGDEVTLQ